MKKLKRRQAKKYAVSRPQWELDYDLQAQDDLSLFWQYLEIGKVHICYTLIYSSP